MKQSDYSIANPHLNSWKALLWVFVASLVLIAGGIAFYFYVKNTVAGFDRISATISEISFFGSDSEDVYVDYTYKGSNYTHQLFDTYVSGWHVGTIVDAYVNPSNPYEIRSALSTNVAPYFLIGFGSLLFLIASTGVISDLVNRHVFFPRRSNENRTKARITGVMALKHNLFRILFSKGGKTYQSGRLRGDSHLVDTLAKKYPIDCPVYLDSKGHFAPDYEGMSNLLNTLKNQEGLTVAPDYHGLSPNDDGSHRF